MEARLRGVETRGLRRFLLTSASMLLAFTRIQAERGNVALQGLELSRESSSLLLMPARLFDQLLEAIRQGRRHHSVAGLGEIHASSS
jgi:hypothetical protein